MYEIKKAYHSIGRHSYLSLNAMQDVVKSSQIFVSKMVTLD